MANKPSAWLRRNATSGARARLARMRFASHELLCLGFALSGTMVSAFKNGPRPRPEG